MNKLITIANVLDKFTNASASLFIGEFDFLEYIVENEESVVRYLKYKYGSIVSGYYDDNAISDIQYSILSFNIVNRAFFDGLASMFYALEESGEYDEIVELTRNYGVDMNTMVYGAELLTKNYGATNETDVFGGNRVVTGTSGTVENTTSHKGLNSNTFNDSDKATTSYDDYEVESNSDSYTNTKAVASRIDTEGKQAKTDTNTRSAREDGEVRKVRHRTEKGYVGDYLFLWEKMFVNVYLSKLIDYMGIGVFS